MTAHREYLLPSGETVLIDAIDWPLISARRWFAHRQPNATYARTAIVAGQPCVLMHRLILGDRPGFDVDHINHNGLDNRRVNLRWATRRQNVANQLIARTNTSGYKGVSWHKKTKKWRAQIGDRHGRSHLGYFATAEDAAHAYDLAAIERWGEFARPNFTEVTP